MTFKKQNTTYSVLSVAITHKSESAASGEEFHFHSANTMFKELFSSFREAQV